MSEPLSDERLAEMRARAMAHDATECPMDVILRLLAEVARLRDENERLTAALRQYENPVGQPPEGERQDAICTCGHIRAFHNGEEGRCMAWVRATVNLKPYWKGDPCPCYCKDCDGAGQPTPPQAPEQYVTCDFPASVLHVVPGLREGDVILAQPDLPHQSTPVCKNPQPEGEQPYQPPAPPHAGEAANLQSRVERAFRDAKQVVQPLIGAAESAEYVPPEIMNMVLKSKGMSVDETFEWLRQRSNRLTEVEAELATLKAKHAGEAQEPGESLTRCPLFVEHVWSLPNASGRRECLCGTVMGIDIGEEVKTVVKEPGEPVDLDAAAFETVKMCEPDEYLICDEPERPWPGDKAVPPVDAKLAVEQARDNEARKYVKLIESKNQAALDMMRVAEAAENRHAASSELAADYGVILSQIGDLSVDELTAERAVTDNLAIQQAIDTVLSLKQRAEKAEAEAIRHWNTLSDACTERDKQIAITDRQLGTNEKLLEALGRARDERDEATAEVERLAGKLERHTHEFAKLNLRYQELDATLVAEEQKRRRLEQTNAALIEWLKLTQMAISDLLQK